jgi:hypothetical protein
MPYVSIKKTWRKRTDINLMSKIVRLRLRALIWLERDLRWSDPGKSPHYLSSFDLVVELDLAQHIRHTRENPLRCQQLGIISHVYWWPRV